jgi:benzoyl-CoA reductase/2-hydroxyglutaryl-CoA dehydratase subunit BcrC/BadD/HgdB
MTDPIEEALAVADELAAQFPNHFGVILAAELRRQSQELERAREALERIRMLTRNKFVFNTVKVDGEWISVEEMNKVLAAITQPAQKQGAAAPPRAAGERNKI